MGAAAKDHPVEYFASSACAAAINYPLWRASSIAQSGFALDAIEILSLRVPTILAPYVYAFCPPFKGMLTTVAGMTWARAAIFWGSDAGRDRLRLAGYGDAVATVVPPLLVSTAVQCINMPIVRATITIQDPKSKIANVPAAVQHIYQHYGITGLWRGLSAGCLKTVPKYITAVVVKECMEEWLTEADPASPTYESDRLWRSAYKSAAAGLVGAATTNGLDVIRNEMFKTNNGLTRTVQHLWKESGYRFLARGMGKNMVAVAIPLTCTIFFTDAFIALSSSSSSSQHEERGRLPSTGSSSSSQQ